MCDALRSVIRDDECWLLRLSVSDKAACAPSIELQLAAIVDRHC